MTDHDSDKTALPEDPGVDSQSADPAGGTHVETPPGMLPLGPRVFGKWAFLITAVPFLIYWGGTAFGSYLETTRKLEPVHKMRGVCRGTAKIIREHIETSHDAEKSAKLLNQLSFSALENALDDESSDASGLYAQCQPFLDAVPADDDINLGLQDIVLTDFSPNEQEMLQKFRAYVEHFLELETMSKNNQLDDIRKSHVEFVAKHSPEEAAENPHAAIQESWYPTLYTIACLSAFIAVLIAMPGYLTIPFRVHGLAWVVGVVGIVVWIGLWWLDKEVLGIGALFSEHARAGFNPLEELKENPTWAYGFLAIRLLGLAIVIPIAEEFFLRGFFMRYVEDIDWDQIPMGLATWKSVVGVIAYGALAHPGEIVAAVAWFGLVTWLYLKTKNVWDCVVAHSVTNALLAAYVIYTSTWELW